MQRIVFPLKPPMQGPIVANLQAALTLLGATIAPAEKTAQHYGASTQQAVSQFQQDHPLQPSQIGFVDEATKLSLLRGAVANVFPSPKEGWGITVMEAAACGTPSIASDSPGLRDSVRNGVTGVLVPHGDVSALAREMLRLVNTPVLVESLGMAARRHAETLTWNAAADAVESHLTELAARGSSPPLPAR